MADVTADVPLAPFEDASELKKENASLLEAIDRRLGEDSRPESEAAALRELEPRIHAFLERGAATGVFVWDVKERTACQVLLDYWSSTLAHAGIATARARLAPFDAPRLPDLKDRQCPFVGLEPIRDGALFYGRDEAVASLLARVAEVPLVVVLGASGSGKSSLVIGGALPLLGAPGHVPPFRIVGPLTPGNAPLESLAGAVAAAAPGGTAAVAAEVAELRNDPGHLVRTLETAGATAILLVVDQFEELFTLCGESDRAALVASLAALLRARPHDRVILTLREEFSSELDKLEPLWPYLARARFSMKEYSMGYDELKAAVERPAALVNLHFARGIVDKMVRSVLGRDTALPLLQFALQSLWKLRDRNRITDEVYAKIGSSPLVALERFADGFYDSLPRESKDEVERILLELVRIDRMLEPYRQPRLRSELLESGSPRTPEVLDLLEREDFVRITPTAGGRDAAVEVKHEALLRNWPRYIDWINGKRERVRQRIALTETAQRWSEGGRSTTERLLSPWQLKEVEHLPDLSPLEAEYIRVSAEAADRDRLARERALKRRERFKSMSAAAFVVLAMIVWTAWYADRQRERRSTLRQAMDVQIQMARVADASAHGLLDNALTGSLEALAEIRRLEGEAYTGARSAQARAMLLSTLRQSADVRRLFVADGAVFQTVAFHPTRPDALLAYAGADGRAYVAGLDQPVAQTLDTCGVATTTAVAFDPTGRLLAAACSDGTLSVWSTDDWRKLGGGNKRAFAGKIWTIAVSPDGRLIAAGGYHDRVALVALAGDGTPTDQPSAEAGGAPPVGYVWSLAFSPAGDTLLVGDGAGALLACRAAVPASWNCAKTAAYPGDPADAIRALAYAADGSRIAVGHWKGGVELWDASFRAASRVQVAVGDSLAPVHSLAFFEACGRRQLAVGKGTGLLYQPVDAPPPGFAPPAGCATPRSASVGDEVYGIATHGPSGRVAAATRGGYVAVLDPTGASDPLRRVVTPAWTKQGVPLRGAIVAEEGSTSWLSIPIASPGPDKANLALLRLRDGVIDENFVRLAAGDGTIERVATSRQSRRLATLACVASAAATSCTAKDAREIAVWRLADDVKGLTPIVSLGAGDFGSRVPSRIALSPDGNWLSVSFDSDGNLLVVSVAERGSKTWIATGLRAVREIAYSDDGRFFAAGGVAPQPEAGTGVDRVRLWNVVPSGLEPAPHPPLALSLSANKTSELAFAEDRRGHPLVLAGGEFGAIDRWDVGSGRMLGTLRADSWPIHLMAFSPREALVAAVDYQNIVRLWDTSSWIPLRLTPPMDRAERPGFVGFVGNGAWLATGSSTLQLWDLRVGSLQSKLCALLRAPGQHGADSQVPLWHPDDLCSAR